MSRFRRTPRYSLGAFCAISAVAGLGQTKKTANTAADLPRFKYPLTQTASSFSPTAGIPTLVAEADTQLREQE